MDEIRDLECEVEGLVMKRELEFKKAELEKAMEVYKTQYDGLCLEVQKAILRNRGDDDELKKLKAMCDGLTQKVRRLEEEKKVVREREKREKDGNEKYVRQLKTEIWHLQCDARKAEGEMEDWKKRYVQLETESQPRIKREAELEEELEDYRVKYDRLSVEVEEKKKEIEGKMKALSLKKINADFELNKYKKNCEVLKKRISRLDEEQKVVCEREKKAQARISYLEMELKKKGSDESSKYVELITENRDLECGKKRAEDEINDWKKRFGELKGMLLDRMAIENELKEYKKTCNGLKDRIKDLEEEQKVICEKKKRAQDKITNLEKELKKKESDEREKYVERLTDLESRKKRADEEVDVWRKRFAELETQVLRLNQVASEKSEIEKELEGYKIQCHGLSEELEEKKLECGSTVGKLKDLLLRKIVVDDELDVYKTICNRLKGQIMGLEGDQEVLCEKEKRAQERIVYLEEKIKNIESDEREKYLELVKQLDTGVWKKQFKDLETQVLRMKHVELEKAEIEKELQILLTNHKEFSMELEEKKKECVAVEEKFEALKLTQIAVEDELKDCKRTCNGLKQRIVDLEEDHKDLFSKEKRAQERINYLEEVIRKMEDDGDVHITGPASIYLQCKPLVNCNEDKKNTPLESKVEFGNSVKQQLVVKLGENTNKKIAQLNQCSAGQVSRGIIDISDSEDEKEISPKNTCDIGDKKMVHVSTNNTFERSSDNEKYLTPKKCLKRPYSDQKGVEYGSSCEEDIPHTSTPKRKRALKIVTSENESEDDDRILIGKLKTKKLGELNKHVSLRAENATLSSGCQNVKESITPSRRRLISLSQADVASSHHMEMGGKSLQMAGDQAAENGEENAAAGPAAENDEANAAGDPAVEDGEENVAEEIGSDSEGESLGGFMVKESDSSDSGDSYSAPEDAEDMDLALDQVSTMIRRNSEKESMWQFEADMLSSFEEDPKLCMKAVCALYRQQTSEEKSMKGSLHNNNREFSKFDALRGPVLAEFFMNGDREADLKKSVKELEKFDPRGLEECKRLARHYSKQLFNIYQKKEDPFFLPSSSSR